MVRPLCLLPTGSLVCKPFRNHGASRDITATAPSTKSQMVFGLLQFSHKHPLGSQDPTWHLGAISP